MFLALGPSPRRWRIMASSAVVPTLTWCTLTSPSLERNQRQPEPYQKEVCSCPAQAAIFADHLDQLVLIIRIR